jgi:hypothetical protein
LSVFALFCNKPQFLHLDLLGNEIFRHERSQQLLTVLNRLGHTCSYSTILRLHHNAAKKTRGVTINPFVLTREKQTSSEFVHHFLVKVADNFDINPDRLHGDKSIHILNQIVISTPENDEIPNIVADVINEILDNINKTDAHNMVSDYSI